jgi:hypothetical protein
MNRSINCTFRCLTAPPLHKLIQGIKGNDMTQLKGQAELDSYKLTKKEVADYLGISTNAVRMSMRGNNYHNLEYRKGPNGFLFKVPARHGVTMDSYTPGPEPRSNKTSTPGITPGFSKVVKRGATHRGEAKYTSLALKMANEAKTIGAINNKFVDEAHKKAFMEMTEAGFEQAFKNSRVTKNQEIQKTTQRSFSQDNSRTHGKYGGMLNATGLQNIESKEHGRLARQDERKHGIVYKEVPQEVMGLDGKLKMEYRRSNIPDFTGTDTSYYTNGRNAGACYSGSTEPDVAVEFTEHELDRYGPVKERTEFKDKIDESIHRAKRQSLKDKGYY